MLVGCYTTWSVAVFTPHLIALYTLWDRSYASHLSSLYSTFLIVAYCSCIYSFIFFFTSSSQKMMGLQFLPFRRHSLNHPIPLSPFYVVHVSPCVWALPSSLCQLLIMLVRGVNRLEWRTRWTTILLLLSVIVLIRIFLSPTFFKTSSLITLSDHGVLKALI